MKILRKRKIIQKQRLFSWDISPNLEEYLPKKGENLLITIEETKLYKRQINGLNITDKKRVQKLRKEIANGSVLVNGELEEEKGHILTGLGNGKNGNSVLFSKSINQVDRLNYRVYKIVREEIVRLDSQGKELHKTVAIQKVVLESCKGHKANGQGDYLKDQSLRNQANRKRNKKEDNNNK